MAYERPPENPVVYTHKEFGAAFFDRAMPNAYERMFMICRSINYDFDNYNKNYRSPDVANKRRYFKNVMRFIDHPLRYVFWKMQPYFVSGKIRLFPFYWFCLYVGTWWESGSTLATSAKVSANEAVHAGHSDREYGVERFSYDRTLTWYFHHSEGNSAKGLQSNISVPPSATFCRLNYHVRDQNFRKYFAHRERRGADLFTGRPVAN